jgi:nucleotide-binding universal stress UspA family protein
MKKIAVLIDFTKTTNNALLFAKQISMQKNLEIVLIHIHKSRNEEIIAEKNRKMAEYVSEIHSAGLTCTSLFAFGNFFSQISTAVSKSKAGLVIIGTHGKTGLKQRLFGSNILKVVQSLPVPSLVIQDNSSYPGNGFSNVLIPIDKHAGEYTRKLDIAHSLLTENGLIKMYAIYTSESLEDDLKNNLDLSIKYLEQRHWPYEIVEDRKLVYSVGYSKQTLSHIQQYKPDLIAIVAKIAYDNIHFGEMDKDNVILNPAGTPVLCC